MHPEHQPRGTRAHRSGALACAFALPALLLVLAPAPARAQAAPATPKTFFACYVPSSGTTYRIKEPNTPDACHSPRHVEFSWTDGAGAVRTGSPAGGDLNGTYPNPTVARLQGQPVSSTAPSNLQFLQFDGSTSQWKPTTPAAGGDLAGTLPNPAVRGLQGRAVSTAAPSDGQVLTYDGQTQQWRPETQSPPLHYLVSSGIPIAAGHVVTASVTCPGGMKLVSGGVSTSNGSTTVRSSAPFIDNFNPLQQPPPDFTKIPAPTGWQAIVSNGLTSGSATMNLWLICV